MKHKKLLPVLLGIMLILTFTACGSDDKEPGPLFK